MRGAEGDGGFFAAAGTGSAGLYFLRVSVATAVGAIDRDSGLTFRLATLAAFRLVLELLIVKEELFACREYEILSAIDALQRFVLKLHDRTLSRPCVGVALSGVAARLPRQRYAESASRQPPWIAPLGERVKGSANVPAPPSPRNFVQRQSCSLRAFFRLRLRASASLTRFFSPGLR